MSNITTSQDRDLEIVLVEIEGELVVDSRLIAKQLGIQHKNLLETIKKHQSKIESRFGQCAFETETVKNGVGALNEVKFCWLNEGQSTAILTLSKNTDRVVDLKFALVEKFQAQKRQLENPIDRKLFDDLARRVAELEIQAQSKKSLVSSIPKKALARKYVNNRAFETKYQHQFVWREAYDELDYRCGYRVAAGKVKGETKLDKIEQDGQIDNLLEIMRDLWGYD